MRVFISGEKEKKGIVFPQLQNVTAGTALPGGGAKPRDTAAQFSEGDQHADTQTHTNTTLSLAALWTVVLHEAQHKRPNVAAGVNVTT